MWLEKFSPFITKSRTLKVGNGLGHLSESIRPLVEELVILDIDIFPQTVNKDKVQLYSGYPIPYSGKSFETSIAIFTLHHIPHSDRYFEELIRVTNKRIILLEETYDNVFQKFHLFLRDGWINREGDQPVKLYWNSYFSRKRVRKLIKKHKLKEVFSYTKRHKTYFKELFVLDITQP